MKRQIPGFRTIVGGAALCAALATLATSPSAQETAEAGRKAYDELLDTNVRDGWVYYRAMRSERARLDSYVNALAAVNLDGLRREDQIALWLNAYNAIVLQTVVEHYPIVQRTRDYPPRSIRQIPGAFERLQHRVAGKTVTLDQIEQTMLPPFNDARVFLALGRGAVGSARLRSEVFTGADLERQLAEAGSECAARSECVQIHQSDNVMKVNSVFSWRRAEFSAGYAEKAPKVFAERSPIERAVLALVYPRFLTTERDFIDKNMFKVEYLPFDWSLNDLTGRGGR
jgi:Protein of unknown function, DUF547